MSKPQTVRRFEAGRLVYYSQVADETYWHEVWHERLTKSHYAAALRGELEYLDAVFTRWLPADEPVLEAGCGRGQIVLALQQRGWNIEGVDYSKETIDALRQLFPDLPVRVGDVTKLNVEDGHYAGYISIGVVEHRREGPEPFLEEAFRVLKPGGIAVITVPYLNPIRRLKAKWHRYEGRPTDLPFYQYAFSETEFADYLRKAGFELVDRQPYGGYKGVIDEIRWARWILGPLKKLPFIGPPIRRRLAHGECGHMLALVARKPA